MNIEKRYLTDSNFRELVDRLEKLINPETGLTPLDIRDAAFLARLNYERRVPHPIIFSDNSKRGPFASMMLTELEREELLNRIIEDQRKYKNERN